MAFVSRGGGALPSNRLMGMCRWMGSHFHYWIDYNGVAFSMELLEWGRIFSAFWGKNILASGKFGYIKKYRMICDRKMGVKYVFYIHFNKCVNPF